MIKNDIKISISEKNGCIYTWNYKEDILMYAPLLQNNAFNFTDLMDVTDIEDKEFYKLKEILREVKLNDQK